MKISSQYLTLTTTLNEARIVLQALEKYRQQLIVDQRATPAELPDLIAQLRAELAPL